MNKCLVEGAQEFMLKPLQQSDVKKLRCHMMKFRGGYAWEVMLTITLLVWGWPGLLHILFCICTSREFDRKHGVYDSSGFFHLFPIMGGFGLLDLLLD
ncbi:hypothetical protein ACSBR2_041750 [Camellia fascicularis]